MLLRNKQRITHVAFSDESHWNKGRYRGIGLVTLSIENRERIENAISALLKESDVSELKWVKLTGAKHRFAAIKTCHFCVESAIQGSFRVDALLWDIEDQRHKIARRDDIGNLQRMYYHLFKNVLRQRWPDRSLWGLYPDEHTAMDWREVGDFLSRVSSNLVVHRDLFTGGKLRVRLKREFGIEEIRPVKSREQPLVQVADVFVGLGCFSKQKYQDFMSWKKRMAPQQTLFPDDGPAAVLSRSDEERFRVLDKLDSVCKAKRIGVSLRKNRGLKTYDPKNPINFWWYEPQCDMDKAPMKIRKQ